VVVPAHGTRVLVDIGPFDGYLNHRMYAIPFAGGNLRLVARDAFQAGWAH